MKKLLVCIAALAVICLTLVLVMISRIDPEDLGARVLQEINQAGRIKVEAERFSIHPLKGLEMHNARASGRVESGDVHAEAALVLMRHQILPLLWGEMVIADVLLQSPTVELISRSAAETRDRQAKRGSKEERARKRREKRAQRQKQAAGVVPAVQASDKDGKLRLSIERFAVADGTLKARTRDSSEAEVRVDDLELVLKGLEFDPAGESSTQSVSGRGRVSTGEIVYGDLAAIESSGLIRLESGTAELRELNVRSANTEVTIEALTVLLLEEPATYVLQAAGDLDLNGALGVEDDNGFGPVAMSLGAEGMGPESAEMVGEGVLTLESGAIPGIESVVQIETLVGKPLLTGRKYAETDIDFRWVSNTMVLEPFELVGEGANIGGSGIIDMAGPLDLEIFVRVPRKGLEGGNLEGEPLQSISAEQSMVTVPFKITGTIEDPSVSLSWDGMKTVASEAARSWAEEALEEAKKKASEWLKSQAEDEGDG